jgi:hypothetical protein
MMFCHSTIDIFLFRLFLSGYDQGLLFSLAQEQEKAFDTSWMHEFYHYMWHVAGFPCH